MIRKGANVVIAMGIMIVYLMIASGWALPTVSDDSVPLEGDWYYYHEFAKEVSKTYGACEQINNRVYTQGFVDGATNGIGAMMEQMVITGNETDGYTITVNGEEYYHEP